MGKEKLKEMTAIALGPAAFALLLVILPSESFTFQMRCAIGTLAWAGCWWLLPPVDYTVTALLPLVINALFQVVPMSTVVSQYASDSVMLVIAGMMIAASWEITGLDRRIAAYFLALIGNSLRKQVVFWFLLSVFLSAILPNMVVCAAITPIAVSMLRYVGEGDIKNSQAGSMVLMVIAWGTGIGGLATPLGGAMNLMIVRYLEQITGAEYMYIDWVIRFAPIMVVLLASNLLYLVAISPKNMRLEGSQEYLEQERRKMGRMTRDEAVCLAAFLVAMLLAFTRNLYSDLLPGLIPAYSFIACAMILFFAPSQKGGRIINWKTVEPRITWGMVYMIAGGIAIGSMLTGSGADVALGELISSLGISGKFTVIFVIVAFTVILSDLTNAAAAAAITVPIVISIGKAMGITPIPLVYAAAIGINISYVMPTSIRALPVGYGLQPSFMAQRGLVLSAIVIVLLSVVCWILMEFWPLFLT